MPKQEMETLPPLHYPLRGNFVPYVEAEVISKQGVPRVYHEKASKLEDSPEVLSPVGSPTSSPSPNPKQLPWINYTDVDPPDIETAYSNWMDKETLIDVGGPPKEMRREMKP